MNEDKYKELLDVIRERFVKGEINKNEYRDMKNEIENDYLNEHQKERSKSSRSDFLEDDIISGQYRILRKLGEGGMATVFLGENKSIGKKVAIKKMLPILATDRDLLDRFRREALSQAKLNHPNICQIIDFDSESLSVILEFVEGETLEDILKRKGVLPQNEALNIIKQVLDALNYAHQKKIVHRDIKPSNIMLSSDGIVKITDFGIALIMGEERKTKTGIGVGTPHYMSPEQIMGNKNIDHRTDVYSSGIVLYEMLTGSLPFPKNTLTETSDYNIKNLHVNVPPIPLSELIPSADKILSDIIQKSLAKEPDNRYSGCGEFGRHILDYMSGATQNVYSSKDKSNLKKDHDHVQQKKYPEKVLNEKYCHKNDNLKPNNIKPRSSYLPYFLIFGGVAILFIFFVLIIMIPTLLSSPIAANESSTIGNMRTYFSTQHTYRSVRTPRTFGTAKDLYEENFIDKALGEAIISSGSVILSGYIYQEKVESENDRIVSVSLIASPKEYNKDGIKQFFLNRDGTIYARDSGGRRPFDFPDPDNPEKDGWLRLAE